MLNIETLKTFGANTEEGIKRCVNKEDFYLRMVSTALQGDQIEQLDNALADKDLGKAFELAHTLKGVFGNLSLTPLLEPICAMTELLRSKTDTDYSALMSQCRSKWAELKRLAE